MIRSALRLSRLAPMLLAAGALAPLSASAQDPAAQAPDDTRLTTAIRAAMPGDLDDVRYFDARVDLDGDGRDEALVFLAGPMVCGTGGCPLLVFTPEGEGYRLVTQVSVVRLPVRLSPRSDHGWRNLIVYVAGGGAVAGDVELAFDGQGYPDNATVEPARSVQDLAGTEILIPQFESYRLGKPLTAVDD